MKGHQLSKNTIVIITADHGEEFNENHQNYWGMRAIIHRDKCIHL
ncbi:hypothetical protein [Candidatus Coxiella mudrowiae]|nr:hypothetical protein [Candidatus Coxiella mudrowiae]